MIEMQICKRKEQKKSNLFLFDISEKGKKKFYSCVSKNKFIYHGCDENEKKKRDCENGNGKK